MEDDGVFYGHLVHFTVFCYILWTFGIVCGNLVHFFHFGILYQEKSGNHGDGTYARNKILSTYVCMSKSRMIPREPCYACRSR
jgi:hypothetical protein